MVDVIDRQEALDAVNHCGMCIQKIVDIPSAQQWISWESGELPKESGWYIVTAYDGRTSRTTFAKYQKRLKRWDLTGARAYWRVLAFMPMPKPWEGRRTDG